MGMYIVEDYGALSAEEEVEQEAHWIADYEYGDSQFELSDLLAGLQEGASTDTEEQEDNAEQSAPDIQWIERRNEGDYDDKSDIDDDDDDVIDENAAVALEQGPLQSLFASFYPTTAAPPVEMELKPLGLEPAIYVNVDSNECGGTSASVNTVDEDANSTGEHYLTNMPSLQADLSANDILELQEVDVAWKGSETYNLGSPNQSSAEEDDGDQQARWYHSKPALSPTSVSDLYLLHFA
jgi:hypothetical protein